MAKGLGLLREFLTTFQVELAAQLVSAVPNTSRHFAIERQLQRARKRARLGNTNLLIDGAIAKFRDINHEMALLEVALTSDEISEARDFICSALWQYTSSIDEECFQSSVTMQVIADEWRHGPGASNGMVGTHMAYKIGQRWSATKRTLPYLYFIRRKNAYLSACDMADGMQLSLVKGSRLSFVPKNEDSVRTIAIEPGGNMAVQLAVGRHIENALRSIGLDITNQQPKNQRLACEGSLTGNLATLDLSSASDRISPTLVQKLFPSDLFYTLLDIRSPSAVIPSSEGEVEEDLHMISTMGNGTTFPVMTLLLCGLVYANRRLNFGQGRRNWLDWSSTGIFGDDIIVKTEEAASLVDMLERAGLVVNNDKSYTTGLFRESCGGDYYLGVDVTPTYVKSLTSESEVYTVVNNLLTWCSAHNVDLPRTFGVLRESLPADPCFVPEWMPIESGIRTRGCSRSYTYLRITAVRHVLRAGILFTVSLAAGGYVFGSAGRGWSSKDLKKQKAHGKKCAVAGCTPNSPCPSLLALQNSFRADGRAFYTPREEVVEVRRVEGQLPKGWLDGWDPVLRTQRDADCVAQIISDYL